jgi:hypothetical protein
LDIRILKYSFFSIAEFGINIGEKVKIWRI